MRHRAPLIGGLVAVVLVVAYWFLLYKPALADQSAFEAETVQLEDAQEVLRTEIAQLEAIRDDETRIRAVVARLEEFVPTGLAQSTVVRQFQQAADDASIGITSVSFGEPTLVEGAPDTGDPATALASIAVSMVTEGGYFPTVDFFRRVEDEVPRAVLTQSVNFAEGEKGFPSLATTWAGQLFAVVPVAATVAPEDPSAAPGEPAAGDQEGTQS